jgi:tRNA(fMet)-specific endonuclease VapC
MAVNSTRVLLDWGDRRRKLLETTLRNFVVVPYDHDVARCYGRLVTERETQGRRIQPNDAWIAACAVRHAVPLVTHNAKDFEGITSLDIITETVE